MTYRLESSPASSSLFECSSSDVEGSICAGAFAENPKSPHERTKVKIQTVEYFTDLISEFLLLVLIEIARENKFMRIISLATIVLVALTSYSIRAWSQDQTSYRSDADAELTVRSISLLPVFDNLQGVYARPIEKDLTKLLKGSHHFNYLDSNYAGPITTPDELEEDPSAVDKIFADFPADAFIAVSISKGPAGISVKMDLFLKSDKRLIAQAAQTGIENFDTTALEHRAEKMVHELLHKLPYSGLILSREGTRVTVNLGRIDGVVPNEILSVIEIIKVKRHPKFDFLVGSEKEIIGQVRLLKVDDTLSFGRIVTEVDAGAIQVNSKIGPIKGIVYPNTNSLSNLQTPEDVLMAQPGANVNYGKNPTAWVPTKQPTFGMVGARFGVGRFAENAPNALSDSAAVFPTIFLDGELWLTSEWSAHAHIRQGIISTSNPVSGGSPSTLSHRLSMYDFLFGYNIRLADAVSAPKLEFLFGYSSYDMFVDQSTPAGITSKTYSGPEVGLSGWYPLAASSPYGIGANFYYMYDPHLSESPTSSGSSTNRATQFGIFLDKQLRVNLKARFELDFDIFASDFSAGSTSSQEQDVFSGGLYYMF